MVLGGRKGWGLWDDDGERVGSGQGSWGLCTLGHDYVFYHCALRCNTLLPIWVLFHCGWRCKLVIARKKGETHLAWGVAETFCAVWCYACTHERMHTHICTYTHMHGNVNLFCKAAFESAAKDAHIFNEGKRRGKWVSERKGWMREKSDIEDSEK